MKAEPLILQMKYADVIQLFAERQGISLDEALDFFYHSKVYQLLKEGISDMHCMNEDYLAEDIEKEYLAIYQ